VQGLVFRKKIQFAGTVLSIHARSKAIFISGKFVPGKIVSALLVLPMVVVLTAAIWLAVASVIENVHFQQAVDQIINIVDISRNYAVQDRNFATQSNEDVLVSLSRAGMISLNASGTPLSVVNPWGRKVIVFSPRYSIVRIETSVPDHDCRRLAMFFAKDIKALGVQSMEARTNPKGLWRRFYDRRYTAIPGESDVEAACDLGSDMTLALIFGVR